MAAKTPAPRDPKKMPFGAFGSTKQPPEYTLFGEPGEIENRVATGYRLAGTPPESAIPSFNQIRPGPTDRDFNRPAPEARSGNSKYGNPRRYH